MTYLTKKQLQERFIDEFLRRLREAPEGERVYMRVGDLFKLADVHSIDELRAARRAAVVRDHDDDEGEPPRDPNDDDDDAEDEEGDAEPDDDLEPPVVREPDE
jgi:hypothetical protein